MSTLDVPDDKKPFLLDGLTFSPDGHWLVSSDGFLLDNGLGMWLTAQDIVGKIRFYDPRSGKLVRELKDETGVAFKGVSFSSDAKKLVWGDNQGQVHLANLSKEFAVVKFSGQSIGINSLSVNDAGNRLVSGGNEINIWDLNEGFLSDSLSSKEFTDSVAIASDNERLASISNDGILRFWNFLPSLRNPSNKEVERMRNTWWSSVPTVGGSPVLEIKNMVCAFGIRRPSKSLGYWGGSTEESL